MEKTSSSTATKKPYVPAFFSLLPHRLTLDPQGVKPVTAALYASPLNLTPQPSGSTTIRVPVPKPDLDKRQQLVRDAQNLCEKARIAVRQVRIDGQKEIKADVDGKVIGKEEGRSEGKKVRFSIFCCFHMLVDIA